jgi:hypothetical protein
MEKLEFKSQICTTKEQSKRLLELGLKKETADMVYTNASLPFIEEKFNIICKEYSQLNNEVNYEISPFTFIPAWSLHRLMEIAYKGDILGCVALNFHERNIGAYYEQVIKVIEYLIRIKEFNKDYLEDKQ